MTTTIQGGWGRHLWVYAEESGSPDNVAWLVQKFLKKFRPDQCWSLTYSTTCSKPRVGEFGGGAVFVTADDDPLARTPTISSRTSGRPSGGKRRSTSLYGTTRSRAAPRASLIRQRCTSPTSSQPRTRKTPNPVARLTDEYVEVDGKQLRESDGIVFEYKGDKA